MSDVTADSSMKKSGEAYSHLVLSETINLTVSLLVQLTHFIKLNFEFDSLWKIFVSDCRYAVALNFSRMRRQIDDTARSAQVTEQRRLQLMILVRLKAFLGAVVF